MDKEKDNNDLIIQNLPKLKITNYKVEGYYNYSIKDFKPIQFDTTVSLANFSISGEKIDYYSSDNLKFIKTEINKRYPNSSIYSIKVEY